MSAAGFETRPAALPGCIELRPPKHADARGDFVKIFHRGAFAALGLTTGFAESYYTRSRRGVVRGLHFQRPPAEHAKLVCCTEGQVQDVALDLRAGSPAYGRHTALTLCAEAGNMLYLPAGLAHGFCALSDSATVLYLVSSEYSPAHDAGIAWDSAGIAWAAKAPILSERDAAHPPLAGFVTPFRYRATEASS